MQEIKCPNCGKVFQIDETSYESIVKQIRDNEFNKQIDEREKQYKTEKEHEIKLAEVHIISNCAGQYLSRNEIGTPITPS